MIRKYGHRLSFDISMKRMEEQFVLTKNQQETKLRAKTMPAALLHRISLEEDKVDLELLLEYLFQKIRGPPPKGAFNGNV